MKPLLARVLRATRQAMLLSIASTFGLTLALGSVGHTAAQILPVAIDINIGLFATCLALCVARGGRS